VGLSTTNPTLFANSVGSGGVTAVFRHHQHGKQQPA
jgi:hypothetical protein